MVPLRTSLFLSLSSHLPSTKKYLLVTSYCSKPISTPTPNSLPVRRAASPLSRPEGSARLGSARGRPFNRRDQWGERERGGPAPRRVTSCGRRAAGRCVGQSSPVMATVREKAAALSLSAVCSPATRPPGTGRGAGWRGDG